MQRCGTESNTGGIVLRLALPVKSNYTRFSPIPAYGGFANGS